ncbi:MAG: glycine--tRNA ligase subunit beta, partial [Gammaproteobacteria bacterium]
MKTSDLLVEIGTEELPPKALHTLASAFANDLIIQLIKARLVRANQTDMQFFSSPRRIAVLIPKIPKVVAAMVHQRSGPAVSAAFDKDGKPTAAATGFAKSCGVSIDQLERKQTAKGEQLVAKIQIPGKPASEVIPEAVETALKNLPVPKRMRWGAREIEFVRPVHWVVILHGKEIINAEILGVQSGRETRGHRFHAPDWITIKKPSNYSQVLETKGHVKVNDGNQSLLREMANMVGQEAAKLNGVAIGADLQGELLAEAAAIVEWPVAVVGQFDQKYLELPDEVLITTLQHHQRYFPVRSQKGTLLPNFITFANIESRRPEIVQHGNERVVVPRLEDAMFFWNSDRQTSLEKRREKLAAVTFQQGLGSLAEKSERVATLAETIARVIGGNPALAQRAAELAKCDLLTDMVREFPELQGIMGQYYARNDGEPGEVCQAIREQYLPRFAGDQLPETKAGMALALADKLDTIVKIFRTGQIPSGNKDPFALRRQALGILRIVIENDLEEIDLDALLKPLIETAAAEIESRERVRPEFSLDDDKVFQQAVQPFQDTKKQVFEFFVDRFMYWVQDKGVAKGIVNGVSKKAGKFPYEWWQKILPISRDSELLKKLIGLNKRIGNILKQAEETSVPICADVDNSLLHEDSEKALFEIVNEVGNKVIESVVKQNFENAFELLTRLEKPLSDYFDNTMVMVDDDKLKENRIALL